MTTTNESLFKDYVCVDEEAVNHPKYPSEPFCSAVQMTFKNIKALMAEIGPPAEEWAVGIVLNHDRVTGHIVKEFDYVVLYPEGGRKSGYWACDSKTFERLYQLKE